MTHIPQGQTSLLDAYICSKCLEVHLSHDPHYHSHFSFRFTSGVGKIARSKLIAKTPQPPAETPPKKPPRKKRNAKKNT